MRPLLLLFVLCSSVLAQDRILPILGLRSPQGFEQALQNQIFEASDADNVEERIVETAPVYQNFRDDDEETAEEAVEATKKVVKPWSRYDSSRRFFHRRRHEKTTVALIKQHRQMETDLLEELPKSAIEQYYRIRLNDKISRAERNDLFSDWAKEYGCESKLAKFLQQEQEFREAKKSQLNDFLDSLGDKVREVIEVLDDDNQTKEKQRDEIRSIVKSAPEGVDRVLSLIFPRAFRPRRNIRPSYKRYRAYRFFRDDNN